MSRGSCRYSVVYARFMAQPLRWPRDEWAAVEAALSDAVRRTSEQHVSNVLVDSVDEWLAGQDLPVSGALRELAVIRAHRDLLDTAEHQIVHFAARAREEGLPWSAIAAALRISHPETAMARWGERVRAEQERYRDAWSSEHASE
jgi:hypothetical protein